MNKAKRDAAVRHLRAADDRLAVAIDRVGPLKIRLERDGFKMLARSIISQQLSTAAARTIRGRLEGVVGEISAEAIAPRRPATLRKIGLSGRKAEYILDLARRSSRGEIDFRTIRRLPTAEAIDKLVSIRGVGRWTAEMFVIFSMGRLDVFPAGDAGVMRAVRKIYGLKKHPSQAFCRKLSARWYPYQAAGCWYGWRALDSGLC